MSDWIKARRSNPCPVCGKPDWCGMTSDGNVVRCMRVESLKPSKGGWIHRMNEPVTVAPPKPKPKNREQIKDFAAFACECQERLLDPSIVADEFGVSERAVERLQVGLHRGATTWPMRDSKERVIGVRLRGKDGRKWCIEGSHNGVFWPEGVVCDSSDLWLPEGGSDCAALLTLGFNAIGRPACRGGVESIVEILKCCRRTVIVVADNDEAKYRPDGSEFFPGQEGAKALAKAIRPFVYKVKVFVPSEHKDIRRWLQAGLTRDALKSITSNMEAF